METIKLKDGTIVSMKPEPTQDDCDAYDAVLYEGINATRVREKSKKSSGAEGDETDRQEFTISPQNLARATKRLTCLMIVSAKLGDKDLTVSEAWLGGLGRSDYRKLSEKAVELKDAAEDEGNE